MTLTRAFNDLEAAAVFEIREEGRVRTLIVDGDPQSLWEQTLPLLRSPVKKVETYRITTGEKSLLLAGLFALSKYSMLAAPKHRVFALTSERLGALKQQGHIEPTDAHAPESVEIETWTYDPDLLVHSRTKAPRRVCNVHQDVGQVHRFHSQDCSL